MTASADDFLQHSHERYRTAFGSTLSEAADVALRASAVQTVSDLAACVAAIAARPEKEVFELSVREYQYAMIAASHGSYRQAFTALRLSFELWLAAISFSASERELRAWRARKQDIVWGKLIAEDNGVLSKNFVSLFCSSLEANTASFRVMGERFYRECSEYVHGNHHTHQNLPEELTYDQASFREWCAKAETFKLITLYCFTYRFAELIPGSGLAAIGAPIGDALGHIPEIRQLGI